MKLVIDGVLDQNLPWELVGIGVGIGLAALLLLLLLMMMVVALPDRKRMRMQSSVMIIPKMIMNKRNPKLLCLVGLIIFVAVKWCIAILDLDF